METNKNNISLFEDEIKKQEEQIKKSILGAFIKIALKKIFSSILYKLIDVSILYLLLKLFKIV